MRVCEGLAFEACDGGGTEDFVGIAPELNLVLVAVLAAFLFEQAIRIRDLREMVRLKAGTTDDRIAADEIAFRSDVDIVGQPFISVEGDAIEESGLGHIIFSQPGKPACWPAEYGAPQTAQFGFSA